MSSLPKGYLQAGVDLAAADETLRRIKDSVASTYTAGVLRGLGAFGGLYEVPAGYRRPVLAASTDGVGTKVKLAVERGAYASVGRDLVNHCVNDILVQGATPLFFLDYVASSRLDPAVVAEVVAGVARGCRETGMALLGGETAEMPGVYASGELDLVGTVIGIVEHDEIVDGSRIVAGDLLLALPSGGLQTNGFSLARSVLAGRFDEPFEGGTVADALLAPHESFLSRVRPLLAAGLVKGMAHVTGGGMPGNLTRTLPAGLGAVVERGTWPEPPVFAVIQAAGEIDAREMFEVFNMGVGMVLFVAADALDAARELLGDATSHVIGRVLEGSGVRIA